MSFVLLLAMVTTALVIIVLRVLPWVPPDFRFFAAKPYPSVTAILVVCSLVGGGILFFVGFIDLMMEQTRAGVAFVAASVVLFALAKVFEWLGTGDSRLL